MGLVTGFRWVGAAALAGMVVLTCLDVVLRGLGHPLLGAVEGVGFLATLALACSLPHTHVARGHAAVDMVVRRLRPRVRAGVDIFTGLLSTVLFAAIAWKTMAYAATMRASGEVSMTMEFPTYLLVYVVALSFGVLCLTGLLDLITAWLKVVKK